ncbi:MAG TPA: carbohydrate kinase family protein [Terriglobales bacterium]|nr:carbohydrate kinase family protein [Terriglobales bacterium]
MPRFDVTLAGELQLDLILYGVPEELPRERELVADGMMLTLGGSSTNAAHNLAALGCRVGFIARIGDDPLGRIAMQRLANIGVDVSRVQSVSGATKTGITVVLQRENWRNMVSYLGTICELTFEDLDLDYLADSRHFHLSSFYLQGGLQPRVPELFEKLKHAGLTISLDTNDDPLDCWQGGILDALKFVDVFLPNEREARRITGVNDLEPAIQKLASIVPVVVVKLGADGALARRGRETFRSPAVDVPVVDAVGAGDSFNAGFLSKYVRGADLPSCLAAGNAAGALSATRPGGTEAFTDRQYMQQFLDEHTQPTSQAIK